MHRIMIAIGSDDFSATLEAQLSTAFSVVRCSMAILQPNYCKL